MGIQPIPVGDELGVHESIPTIEDIRPSSNSVSIGEFYLDFFPEVQRVFAVLVAAFDTV